MKKLFTLFICVFFSGFILKAQYSPTTKRPITVHENFGETMYNYAVRIVFDTQTEISAGNMRSDCGDIRFADNACGNNYLPYYIQSGVNTANTVIWVKVPQLDSASTAVFYIYYGDPNATTQSSFSATFPNAIITTGNTTVANIQNAGWVQVNPGHVLTVSSNGPAKINASYINIAGELNVKGKGYAAPTSGPSMGNGPAGGAAGSSSGAGGGGYGGAGGAGGYDSGDPVNAGGAPYGSATTFDIEMGSSGGTASGYVGGSGGGSIVLQGAFVSVSGTINADGNNGVQPGGGQGAGGGAGGGILIAADSVVFSGILSANGGNGSVGTSTANDDGGGGGGGRIKIFHDSYFGNTGTMTVVGGVGGPNGTAAGGQNGASGTTNDDLFTYTNPTIGAPQAYVNLNTSSQSTQTSCDNYTWSANNEIYSISGTYFDTLVNGAGCDSLLVLNLTINNSSTATVQASNCESYTWPLNNMTYTASGNYLTTITNAVGCDSVVTLELIVLESTTNTISVTDCDSYLWPTNSTTYTTSGTYSEVITNAAGCDSTITLDLTINYSATSTETVSACESFIWAGQNYTNSGSYTTFWSTSEGCDSVATLQLTIDALGTNDVTQNISTLTADENGASYQWLDCGNSFAAIAGETSQSFAPTANGSYAVEISSGACVDTSSCVDVTNVSVEIIGNNALILSAFPNPTSGEITLHFGADLSRATLVVTTITGQVVDQRIIENQNVITVNLPDEVGVYFIELVSEKSNSQVVKVVKI